MNTVYTIQETAHAKINLSLDITGRRPNGYHDVRMIMTTIGLTDEVTLERTKGEDVVLTTDNDILNAEACEGKDNLIIKACNAFWDEGVAKFGVKIHLAKKIPMAAGMAGGSADAAATLRGLNRLAGNPFSLEKLCTMAVKVGADVPFCVMEGAYLCEGIGEILTKIEHCPKLNLVICKPPVAVPTKEVYTRYDSLSEHSHPDVDGMLEAMKSNDVDTMAGLLGNSLESVTAGLLPEISQIERKMMELGAIGTRMSGSGPTVFGIFANKELQEQATNALKAEHSQYEVFATGIYEGKES